MAVARTDMPSNTGKNEKSVHFTASLHEVTFALASAAGIRNTAQLNRKLKEAGDSWNESRNCDS